MSARRMLALAATATTVVAAAACDDDDPVRPQLQPPPSFAAISQSGNSIRLSWTAASGATSYLIQRAPGASGGAFVEIDASPVTGTQLDDTGLEPGSTYRYRIASISSDDTSDFAPVRTATTTGVGTAGVAVIAGSVTTNRTLFADTLYRLNGFVKVTNGATLTVQPGTRIEGDTLVNGVTFNGSSLVITRGAKLVAQGTPANPIVFTSMRPVNSRRPGDWGGIVIVGRGIINRTGAEIYTEGPTEARENYAAGSDNADSSGVLQYVRIEFAGFPVATNEELNSLSMYAVGSKTKIEYVQTVAGLDDAFEWFGGAVDGRYLVSYETGDDHFDWAEGYVGRNQFLIALQTTRLTPRAGAPGSDPRGFEGDGCEIAANKPGCASYLGNTPFSMPVFANFTIVGPAGVVANFPSDGNGAVIRRGSGGALLNGIIARWPGRAINIRNYQTDTLLQRDSLVIRNLLLTQNGANFDPQSGTDTLSQGFEAKFAAAQIAQSTATVESLFESLPAGRPSENATLDWTPRAGTPAATGGLSGFAGVANNRLAPRLGSFFGGPLSGTTYVGAAAPGGADWWAGWTVYITQ